MMEELAYHKTKDKGTLVLAKGKRGFTIAKYSVSDIEEWSVEYANEDEAWRDYRKATEEA